MKTLFKFFAVTSMAFVLSACGGSNGSSNATIATGKTFTDSEHTSDLVNLNSIEKNLENVGLRFKEDFEMRNGLVTKVYSFDKDFLHSFLVENPSFKINDMTSALQNYVKVADEYLKKYSGTFNVKHDDGSVKAAQLKENAKKELEIKIDISNKAITNLQSI